MQFWVNFGYFEILQDDRKYSIKRYSNTAWAGLFHF